MSAQSIALDIMKKDGVIEFSKAQISSLISTVCDFAMTTLVFEIIHHVVGSTVAGSMAGGITNCFINYRWTFTGTKRSKKGVIWRYLLVWAGSVILNTTATEYGVKAVRFFAELWAIELGQPLSLVLIVKAVAAVLVAIFWNFTMQKYYVYRK